MREGLKYRLFRDAGLLSEMVSVEERYRMSPAGIWVVDVVDPLKNDLGTSKDKSQD